MVKQWLITKSQTGGEGLKYLTLEILEKDDKIPISEAEYTGKRFTLQISLGNHVDAQRLNDILTLGVKGIIVRE